MLSLVTRRTATLGCLAALGLLWLTLHGAVADEGTWTAEPARMQLARDPLLIPKGKGMLFVPAMSVPLGNEQPYQVRQGGRGIQSASPGRGVLLDPGVYEVLIGSGIDAQRMQYTVEVAEGSVTLMKPDWSALVIDVIDASRTSVNESYELLGASGESYGLGLGIEEERGERVRTWLLKPGVYHVVKVGESFSTIRKFSVQLLPGQLSQRNLSFNEELGEFIGFYPRPALQAGAAETRSVTYQTEVSGSTTANTSQRTAGEDRTALNVSVQVFNRTRYSTPRNFASIRFIFEEGVTKEGDETFRKSIDRLEIRGTYIYRLSRQFGPYLRGVFNTDLFSDDFRFSADTTFVRLNSRGDTLATFRGPEVTISPSFSPLIFRQGVGINSQLFRTYALNMDVRLGLGAKQTFVSDEFELAGLSATKLKTQTSTGLEALLVMDARLSRFANLDSEFDILMNSRDMGKWVFRWENRLRIFLTSFINLDLVADLEREETLRRLQAREQVLLRFSKFF